jgi:hypothetical protein
MADLAVAAAPCVCPLAVNRPCRLRALAGWRLTRHKRGDYGYTDHEARTISLRADLTWPQLRSTLVHEVLHATRGPALDTLGDREEMRVRKETARLLLPSIHAVADALAWSQVRAREAAADLGVDVDVLWDRLDHLHPAEHHYLRRRLAEVG